MPCDLNADTDQQKGNDAQHAMSEGEWHFLRDEGCVGVEHEYQQTQERNAAEESQKRANPFRKAEALSLSTECQCDGD